MKTFFAAWAIVALCLPLGYIVREYGSKPHDAIHLLGKSFATILFAVPAIFLFGWVFLPFLHVGNLQMTQLYGP